MAGKRWLGISLWLGKEGKVLFSKHSLIHRRESSTSAKYSTTLPTKNKKIKKKLELIYCIQSAKTVQKLE